MKAYKSYIITGGSVVVIFTDGTMTPIPTENPMYGKVVSLLQSHEFDKVADAVDVASTIRKASNGRFYVVDGLVWIDGDTLPDVLSKRLIGFAEAGLPTDSLETFWQNLKENPSLRSRQHLYAFLEHNGIPLTEDGCFIAYKRVDENYMDCHTHTFDNSVGAVVTMDRSKVDENPEQTCSSGLHVAAFQYAKDFYANGHLMEVKVNPKDVVAVPIDYNGEKMRVCEYEVMRECEGPRPDDELLYPTCTDDSADEDDWGIDDKAETCPDCGAYLDECICDCEPEEENEEEDVVDDTAPVSVIVDNRGRVGVPARFVRALGGASGGILYANTKNGKVTLSRMSSGSDARGFVIDKDDAVRVTSYVLNLAGLGSRKQITVAQNGAVIELT